jgi:hypothetical protein
VSASDVAIRERLEPTIKALRDLVDAVRAAPGRHGSEPTQNSPAKRDLDTQDAEYGAVEGWSQPVRDAHACADYALGFSRLCGQAPPPVYAHLVIARSVLEAGVVSAWLNDPSISTHERVRRALSEHLYRAREEERLAKDLDKIEDNEASSARLAAASELLVHWKGVESALELPADAETSEPAIGKVSRPQMPGAISALVSADGSAPASAGGAVQWRYLSSVSHATWQGLKEALETHLAEPVQPGVFTAPSVVRAHSIQIQAFYVLRALRNAAAAQFRLMGWDDEVWAAATLAADQHAVWINDCGGRSNGRTSELMTPDKDQAASD